MAHHKLRTILKILALTLITIIAVLLIFNRQIKYYFIQSYQPRVTQQEVKRANPKKADYNFSKVKSLDTSQAVNARLNPKKIQLAGQILIPAINLHLPIGLGVANSTLALSAGTMRADQKLGSGNYPLAGHHMVDPKILFGPLYAKAKKGQLIYLTNMNSVYVYRITEKRFIAATDVQVINQTKQPIVTLITCDATGAGRLMVRGKYVTKYQFKQASSKIKRALNGPVNSQS